MKSEQFEFDGGPGWIGTTNGEVFEAYADNDITGLYYRATANINDLVFMPWNQIRYIRCQSPVENGQVDNG